MCTVHAVHDRADLQFDGADRPGLIEAAHDAGASRWRVIWEIVLPLSKTGIALGSIFVITHGDGRFLRGQGDERRAERVGGLGAVRTRSPALQYPPAAASAVILVIIVA